MTRYAAFLRGVNVGGINLTMAHVAAALGDAGFADVRTVLASGNVLLDSPEDTAAVRTAAEATLRARFGYQAWVLVYRLDAVRAIADGYPFPPELPGYHSYVTFVADTAVHAELSALATNTGTDEKIAPGDGVVYWQVPKGNTLDSAVGKIMGNKRYRPSITTRNLRTLARILR